MKTLSKSPWNSKMLMIAIFPICFAITLYLGSAQSKLQSPFKLMVHRGESIEGEFKSQENEIAWPGKLRVINLDERSGILTGEVALIIARE